MLLFTLNLDTIGAPPVESTTGEILHLYAPVAIDRLDASLAILQFEAEIGQMETTVVTLQLEAQLANLQLEGSLMPMLEVEV